jgi:hypothetical protein
VRGSFTLVSGVLAYDPIVTGTVASVVNGPLGAFVRAAAIDLPRGQRINAVSATVFEEAWDAYGEYFPGTSRSPPLRQRAPTSSRCTAARPARCTTSAADSPARSGLADELAGDTLLMWLKAGG